MAELICPAPGRQRHRADRGVKIFFGKKCLVMVEPWLALVGGVATFCAGVSGGRTYRGRVGVAGWRVVSRGLAFLRAMPGRRRVFWVAFLCPMT
jgi:hypothetical protein